MDGLKFYYNLAGVGTVVLVVVASFPAPQIKPETQIAVFGLNGFAFAAQGCKIAVLAEIMRHSVRVFASPLFRIQRAVIFFDELR